MKTKPHHCIYVHKSLQKHTSGKYYSLVILYTTQNYDPHSSCLKISESWIANPKTALHSVTTITPPPWYPPVGLSTEVVYKA